MSFNNDPLRGLRDIAADTCEIRLEREYQAATVYPRAKALANQVELVTGMAQAAQGVREQYSKIE